LHLLESFVPVPAGTALGTGVREYLDEAGHSIFQNLPCLLLQELRIEQGSESTCTAEDSLASPEPPMPAPAGTAPGTGVKEYVLDDGQSCIF
jgi:hypothetical protein